ncbi:MAG: hypothetical protein H6726_32405 [Sandaracinaceae bacterium]|nr:hypothetical protein [Sandaracinaceae bacterium]
MTDFGGGCLRRARAGRWWQDRVGVLRCKARAREVRGIGVIAALVLAAGCGGGSGAPGDQGASGDLGAPGALTTYLARHDSRRCAAPACGGYFLQAVNQDDTPCPDGTRAEECYVAELDWTTSGLSDADQVRVTGAQGGFLLDGRALTRAFGAAGNFGVLQVSAAWIAEWGTPLAVPADVDVHALTRTQLLCLLDPCFNIQVDALGTDYTTMVSAVDLSATGASGEQETNGQSALEMGALRAVGTISTDEVAGPGGFGETYDAQQFYLRLPFDPL